MYAAWAVLLVAFLVIYLPDVGHGFIKDDFGWIAGSRLTTADDVRGLFEHNAGFYRPLVSASFAADYALWRFDPFAYGITNLIVVFVDAVLLFCLARKLSASREAALVAVAAWSFNFHGVNMALLWNQRPDGALALRVRAECRVGRAERQNCSGGMLIASRDALQRRSGHDSRAVCARRSRRSTS